MSDFANSCLPGIEILLATYNGEEFLAEQIESIRYQTYENWRLLISDDCSSDGTLEIAGRYAALDPRIEVVSRGVRHGSAKANFMFLLDKSNAEYIMFCDQDDVWFDDKVEQTLVVMREQEEESGKDTPLLVYGDMVVVDEGCDVISNSFYELMRIDSSRTSFNQLLAQNVVVGCTCMVNGSLRDLVLQGESAASSMIMHDGWAGIVASAFGRLKSIDTPLLLYRQHSQNAIGATGFDALRSVRNFRLARKSVRASVRQTQAFYDVYGSALDDTDARVAESHMSLLTLGRISRLSRIARYRLWKGGAARKVGQIAAAIVERRSV